MFHTKITEDTLDLLPPPVRVKIWREWESDKESFARLSARAGRILTVCANANGRLVSWFDNEPIPAPVTPLCLVAPDAESLSDHLRWVRIGRA